MQINKKKSNAKEITLDPPSAAAILQSEGGVFADTAKSIAQMEQEQKCLELDIALVWPIRQTYHA